MKKVRVVHGPIVRYRSYTETFPSDDIEEADERKESKSSLSFINFTHDPLDSWKEKPNPPIDLECAITGLKAHYIDPHTLLPYANLKAYQAIKRILNHEYIWSSVTNTYIHSINTTVEGLPDRFIESTRGYEEDEYKKFEAEFKVGREEEFARREEAAAARKAAKEKHEAHLKTISEAKSTSISMYGLSQNYGAMNASHGLNRMPPAVPNSMSSELPIQASAKDPSTSITSVIIQEQVASSGASPATTPDTLPVEPMQI